MKFNYLKPYILKASVLLSLISTSCGSYEYAGSYNDGIYGSDDEYYEDVEYYDENQRVVQSDNDNYYQNYFSQKSREYDMILGEDEIFTDVDSYKGNYSEDQIDSVQVDSLRYQNAYAGWGQNTNDVTINIYNDTWNRPFFGGGIGWYDWYWGRPWGWNNWGWNSWGWNNWNWGWNVGIGWGWNSWGWNAPFGWGWHPWYGYGGFGWNNYYWNQNVYSRRGYAYNRTRRGSSLLNRNFNATTSNRANTNLSRSRTTTPRRNLYSPRTNTPRSTTQPRNYNPRPRTTTSPRSNTPRPRTSSPRNYNPRNNSPRSSSGSISSGGSFPSRSSSSSSSRSSRRGGN